MSASDAGNVDDAAAALEHNLQLMYTYPDPQEQERSLFALCTLLHRTGKPYNSQNYRKIVTLLEGTLDRFPATPESVRARYQLADAYRQLAGQKTVKENIESNLSRESRDHYLGEQRRWLAAAAQEFSDLEGLIQKPEARTLLTIKEQVEVPFIVAKCRAYLGQYELALQKYEELAARYGNRPEALMALAGGVNCYAMMGDFERLRQRLEDIRNILPGITPLSDADRQQWRDWVERASKGLPPPRTAEPRREAERPERRPEPGTQLEGAATPNAGTTVEYGRLTPGAGGG
jgi:hypothetical protein